MSVLVQVKCITKRGDHYNPHERIQAIGGSNPNGERWWLPEDQAISAIEADKWSFYTYERGVRADVIIAVHNGRKYLETTADGYRPDNLLSLPECPR
jgi:hypothetical protein